MKINVIGGGPAGMYFAILMKHARAAHEITIYERNGPDDTFGWGVVFSGKTLSNLRAADEASHAEITRNFEAWDNVDIVHRGEKISIHGNSFSGIARLRLLNILQQRCEELGVEIKFRTEVANFDSLRGDYDLLVAADGVNSLVRQTFKDRFRPDLSIRPNKYIWYGTNHLFHGLTLTFRETPAGVFAAHSYKFDQTTSTFIVECDSTTWNSAGFAQMSDEETRRYLAGVFAADLNGQPLLSNNSKWLNFLLVKNARWSFENVVLLGDALHTAHFSIGSGTKLAMEDAIGLKECFDEASDVEAALQRFEEMRKPTIEDYQAAAYESMLWFEHSRQYMHLAPIELAYVLMTRSGRVDRESLRRRDSVFVAAYEALRGSNCFRQVTKVKTEVGWKKIECIKRGNLVWTHAGRLRRVVGVQRRPHVGSMVGLRLRRNNVVVWCTPNQQFLIPSPSPQAERGLGGEVATRGLPTPNPSPQAGRGDVFRRLGGGNAGLTRFARNLRQDSTSAEQILWARIRGRQLHGVKFRRQHLLGRNYIVDFHAPDALLAIELDGSVHDSVRSQWAGGIRHRQIQVAGVRVLRFRNERVLEDLEAVIDEISEYIIVPQAGDGEAEMSLCEAKNLLAGDHLLIDETGEYEALGLVELCTANEMVYDLTVEEDRSFITEVGVAHS